MLWDTLAFNDLDEMRRDIDALLEMTVGNDIYLSSFSLFNAYENRDEIIPVTVAPGVTKDSLDLEFNDDIVTLKGERASPIEEGPTKKFLRHEREYGRFEKSFRFPAKIDRAGITAKLENGILVIHAPKTEEAKPKHISIQT